MRRAAAAGLVMVACAGCTPGQRAVVADVLGGVSRGSAWLASAIDAGETGAEVFFARHPDPTAMAKVRATALVAREAQAALDGIVATGEAAEAGDLDAAREQALQAYGHFRALLERLGVLAAKAPEGGAEADGVPMPHPVDLPTVAELGARL